ncbi:hypothetical protein [Bradyrhizobium sp. ORS 285]|uniref:hypothetical protein n=1 Tax=Bradyrhizobium sp. ORS 285 TaxID=115808 RepID=UPI0011126AA0|nr:hypothetical protein [Bradyrhizobium sp. ORS 285]
MRKRGSPGFRGKTQMLFAETGRKSPESVRNCRFGRRLSLHAVGRGGNQRGAPRNSPSGQATQYAAELTVCGASLLAFASAAPIVLLVKDDRGRGMTDQSKPAAPKTAREERLKQALRENLKRRKAQSRERSQAAVERESIDAAAVESADESKQ